MFDYHRSIFTMKLVWRHHVLEDATEFFVSFLKLWKMYVRMFPKMFEFGGKATI